MNSKRKAVQLHFGGGTPTFLLPEEIRALGRLIKSRFEFSPDIEAGVEVDPRRLERDHIVALREAGFNRASMGVQDNNDVVQKAVHRIQPFEQTQRVVGWIREAGFKSVNIDLIYGLPFQTPESFAKTLDEILTLRPDRFAIFNYAHVPWMKPAQKILEAGVLPSAEVKLQLLKLTIEKLTSSGYRYIGMDHFALEDDELAVAQREKTLQRNFQGYSTRGGADIYAFGMSSISQAEGLYWQNQKDLPVYYKALDEGKHPITRGYLLTADDKLRRTTIMRLMCDLSLDFAAMSNLLGVDFADYFARELPGLTDLEEDGLIERSARGLEVTEAGRLLIRNIAMRFDAYLPAQKERRFSRTI
jgi:oxygen-independent coproporphyrinogen-3 oxidase